MMKIDVVETEKLMRSEWAKVAADPKMQSPFGQLQSTGYAVDMHVAGGLWVQTLPNECDGDAVVAAAAAIVTGFISNLLLEMAGTQEGHDVLHSLLFRISFETHESLGFSDEPFSGVANDTPVVMKDVGDA